MKSNSISCHLLLSSSIACHEAVLLCVQDIIAHMATSTSGFFQGQEYHLDLVRLGTVNYLFGNQSSSSAARWLTRITGIKQVQGCEGVSMTVDALLQEVYRSAAEAKSSACK